MKALTLFSNENCQQSINSSCINLAEQQCHTVACGGWLSIILQVPLTLFLYLQVSGVYVTWEWIRFFHNGSLAVRHCKSGIAILRSACASCHRGCVTMANLANTMNKVKILVVGDSGVYWYTCVYITCLYWPWCSSSVFSIWDQSPAFVAFFKFLVLFYNYNFTSVVSDAFC